MVERRTMSSFLLWFFSLILCIGLDTSFNVLDSHSVQATPAHPPRDIVNRQNIFGENPEAPIGARVRRKISKEKKYEMGTAGTTTEKPGSNVAHSQSDSGKAHATALNKHGDVQSYAVNGSQADAFSMTKHDRGQALASSDSHGDGGARTVAVSLGSGNVTGNATSHGKGRAKSMVYSAKGGSAVSNAESTDEGNSTSYAISTGKGESMSTAKAKSGISQSSAVSTGTGNSKSNSLSEAARGITNSIAMSHGGDVEALSHVDGTGISASMGTAKGNGSVSSNAISTDGYSQADAITQIGDSSAIASNVGNESVLSVLGEFLKAGEIHLGLGEEEHESQTHVAR